MDFPSLLNHPLFRKEGREGGVDSERWRDGRGEGDKQSKHENLDKPRVSLNPKTRKFVFLQQTNSHGYILFLFQAYAETGQ